jgi:pimeloyl-ACP methyl ester carboxylesterase
MRTPHRSRVARTLLVGLLAGAVSGALVGAVAGQSTAAEAGPRGERQPVITRDVVFTLTNTNDTDVPCLADGSTYSVAGRLVGPRDEVLGRAGSTRINVLVHDAGTGGWFWNLESSPRHDYAGRLAAQGETSLVLDRLGFDASPLADGRSTCLGAQATMLHQVVQNVTAGIYRFVDRPGASVPHASQVVLHGHGVGAAVAQLEAATFDDVEGLVVMGFNDTGASQAAVREAARQTSTCLGDDYASYGATPADFASLLFSSASQAVQRQALAQRNDTPCGDVTSLLGTLGALGLGTGSIEPPVLVLQGGRDARMDGDAQAQARRFRSSEAVTARTFARAGSALPLERQAPQVRRTVLSWLDTTFVER